MVRSVLLALVVTLVFLATPEVAQPVQQDETTIKEAVKPAIAAGVEFLRSSQSAAGTWSYQGQNSPDNEQVVGATALCGIALMECGVPANDRQVQAAASVVRKAANNPGFTYTYSVCLSLLFLDRLNRDKGPPAKSSDSGSVLKLASTLVRGQVADGRWGYKAGEGAVDNSNTQFGVVGLWVARKYVKTGGQIDAALSRTEQKFRKTQAKEGSWTYDASAIQMATPASGSMTCAGILGIALHAGAKQLRQADFRGAASGTTTTDVYKNLDTDPQVVAARGFILRSLQDHIGGHSSEGHTTYFLWSLERAATLYKWRKIDGVDWFEVGARFLMSKQHRNGFWDMDFLHGANVDTSFALLFLAKSNLLGTLQDAEFSGGKPLGDGPNLSKDKAKPEVKKDVAEHAKELLDKVLIANADKQALILDELSEAKGSEYTEALVTAVDKLSTNASKEAAREALARRFQRYTLNTLNKYLQQDDRELRLAAVSAIRLKNDVALAGSVIPLLSDQDIGVSTAALEALKAISGQDFGKSIDRWSRWLENNKTKKP